MSQMDTSQNTKQKEVLWQQYRLCLAVAKYQILSGNYFPILGPESGKIWWLKKGTLPSEKVPLPLDSPDGQGTEVDFFTILATYLNHLSQYRPRVSIWFQRTGKSDHFLEIVYPNRKIIPVRAPHCRQYALTSDFMDLANFNIQDEAVLATNWIKNRPEGLKFQKP